MPVARRRDGFAGYLSARLAAARPESLPDARPAEEHEPRNSQVPEWLSASGLRGLVVLTVKYGGPAAAGEFREAIEEGLVQHAETVPGRDRPWQPGELDRAEAKAPAKPAEPEREPDAPGWDTGAERRAVEAYRRERLRLEREQRNAPPDAWVVP